MEIEEAGVLKLFEALVKSAERELQAPVQVQHTAVPRTNSDPICAPRITTKVSGAARREWECFASCGD